MNMFGTEKTKNSRAEKEDVFGFKPSAYQKEKYEAEKEIFGDSQLEQVDKAKAEQKKSKGKSLGFKSYVKPEKVKLEPVYADYILSDENYMVCAFGENINLYEWKQSYWSKINQKSGIGRAMKWLRENEKNEATDMLAQKCFATALTTLLSEDRFLPPKPKTIIIPMEDAWLEVHEDGVTFIVEPNKAIGVTYQIKGKVLNSKESVVTDDFGNVVEGAKQEPCTDDFGNKNIYIPKSVPEKSLFAHFLNNSVPKAEDQRLLAQYTGSTLIPDARMQTALVIEGPGKNGKSEYANMVAGMHEKVASLDLDDLTGFGKAELVDASLVIVPETPKRSINEQELKKIISGDKIVINQKHKDVFTYEPTAKMIINCNSFPKIDDESNGVWRRLIMMKFDNVIADDQIIKNLSKRIVDEEMHILVDWAINGLVDLLKQGDFSIPESVKANKEAEKKNSKNVLVFIEDMYVELSEECKMKKDDMYAKYKVYCEEKSWNAFGEVQFWKIMKQKFPNLQTIQKREISGRKLYCNLFFDLSQATDDPEIDEMHVELELEREIAILDKSLARKTISVNEYASMLKKAFEKYAKAK
ncbi:DNA primase family protein [Aquitalea pelogenes]|uniref:DNA primase family protein n=1 Tax=Aquitalea pelogenes TaxID=1293573 RepID=UPI0035B18078